MKTLQPSQSSVAQTNVKKMKFIFAGIVVHTSLWLHKIYSYNFFLFVLLMNFILLTTLYVEIHRPNVSYFMKPIFFGASPSILLISMPQYFIFGIISNFTSLTFGFNEVKWNQLPYLFGSNILGSFVAFLYYWLKISDLASEIKDLKLCLGISTVNYQILTAFVVKILVFTIICINKRVESQVQQRYESELIQLNRELEITNTKLQSSNKELQEALQEKENFILRFSHEIRNPLNSLLGNVELCYEQTTQNKELNLMLYNAKVSGEILLQLLKNVLDTAKVSAGRLEVSISTQSIREFLERAWIICSEIIRKKQIFGCLSVNVNVPNLLEFDHHRIMQILINTISNAAKFTGTGHVKVFVDFIEGHEIRSEDMLSSYFKVSNQEPEGYSETMNQEEMNEKPSNIFEDLTLNRKHFKLNRDIFAKSFKDEVEVPHSFDNHKLRNRELEIITKKDVLAPARMPKESSDTFENICEGYIRFEIIDSGCGMRKKDIDTAFGKFQQVSGN